MKTTTAKSKLELIKLCKEKDNNIKEQEQHNEKIIKQMHEANLNSIEQLQSQKKKEINDIILASAAREAKTVQTAVNKAQSDLSKILINNAEKVRGNLVKRHKTITIKLNSKLSETNEKLNHEKAKSKKVENILMASSILDIIINKSIFYVQSKHMQQFYQNKVSKIKSTLVNQQKMTEQAKEEIKFHKKSCH